VEENEDRRRGAGRGFYGSDRAWDLLLGSHLVGEEAWGRRGVYGRNFYVSVLLEMAKLE